MTTTVKMPVPYLSLGNTVSGVRTDCFTAAQLQAYGDARMLEERERCAKVCEAEHVGQSVDDETDNNGDRAYNTALRHAAAAIREGTT